MLCKNPVVVISKKAMKLLVAFVRRGFAKFVQMQIPKSVMSALSILNNLLS